MHCLQKEFKVVKSENGSLSEKIKIAESDADFLWLSRKVCKLLDEKYPSRINENFSSAKQMVYEWYQTNGNGVDNVLKNMKEDTSSLAKTLYQKKKCTLQESNWIEAQTLIARAIIPSTGKYKKYKNIFKKENGV